MENIINFDKMFYVEETEMLIKFVIKYVKNINYINEHHMNGFTRNVFSISGLIS